MTRTPRGPRAGTDHGAGPEPRPDLGDRVILAAAAHRSPNVLGTVIERDPYPDRDTLLAVHHDDGVTRWHRRDALRTLGHRMPAADLAADLAQLQAVPSGPGAHPGPNTPTLRRQDAGGALGVFRDGTLLQLLPPGDPGEHIRTGDGVEILTTCPDHPAAPAVDCLDCEPC